MFCRALPAPQVPLAAAQQVNHIASGPLAFVHTAVESCMHGILLSHNLSMQARKIYKAVLLLRPLQSLAAEPRVTHAWCAAALGETGAQGLPGATGASGMCADSKGTDSSISMTRTATAGLCSQHCACQTASPCMISISCGVGSDLANLGRHSSFLSNMPPISSGPAITFNACPMAPLDMPWPRLQ